MTPLAQHAALLLATSVLTSTATAYAECAWVLWRREVIAKRDIGWAPRESFKDISVRRKSRRQTRGTAPTRRNWSPYQAATLSASPTPWTPRAETGK